MHIEDLKKLKEKKEQEKQKLEKYACDLKQYARTVFSSPAGVNLARAMMKYSGVYSVEDLTDEKIREKKGRVDMYLVFVKGLATEEQISLIEKGGER